MSLGTRGAGETVRDTLRRALGDPELDIVYSRVGTGGWIDELGEVATTTAIDGRAFTPIARGGKPVAGLIHDRALLDDPARLKAVTEAASLAIDNERRLSSTRSSPRSTHPGPESSTQVTVSFGAWSATSTMAPNSAWSDWA